MNVISGSLSELTIRKLECGKRPLVFPDLQDGAIFQIAFQERFYFSAEPF